MELVDPWNDKDPLDEELFIRHKAHQPPDVQFDRFARPAEIAKLLPRRVHLQVLLRSR